MGTECNICGGETFRPGPGGRMARTGVPPVRERCLGLERHRVLRRLMDAFRTPELATMRALHFAADSCVDYRWFGAYERSYYGGENSIDIQAIDRPDASYDVVICNHVLEHVPRDEDALREFGRIVTARGFIVLSFPSPLHHAVTRDWGYPKAEQHGHYRVYGRDVEPKMKALLPEFTLLAATGRDPVTDVLDLAYIVTRSPRWAERVSETCAARVV